jgi:hypothetical protein
MAKYRPRWRSDYLESVKRLIGTRKRLNRLKCYPRTGWCKDSALLAMLSKSIRVSESYTIWSTVDFVDGGFDEEAFGNTRMLLDIFFSIRYIVNKDAHSGH